MNVLARIILGATGSAALFQIALSSTKTMTTLDGVASGLIISGSMLFIWAAAIYKEKP